MSPTTFNGAKTVVLSFLSGLVLAALAYLPSTAIVLGLSALGMRVTATVSLAAFALVCLGVWLWWIRDHHQRSKYPEAIWYHGIGVWAGALAGWLAVSWRLY